MQYTISTFYEIISLNCQIADCFNLFMHMLITDFDLFFLFIDFFKLQLKQFIEVCVTKIEHSISVFCLMCYCL